MPSDPSVPPGYNLVCLEKIDSTNAEALRRAEKGQSKPLWIIANHQSQGRGRRGRKWIAAPGNLFATLLLNWSGPRAVLSELSFVAAVSCADMLESLIQNSRSETKVRLKWPNDILLNGAKVGGILIETFSIDEETIAVAIGIGMNVANHPTETLAYPTTNFAQAGFNLNSSEVFEQLARRFDYYFSLWQQGAGFENIKQRWLDFGPSIGHQLKVNTGTGIITGNFSGLDNHGGLQLSLSDGSQQIVLAGDIVANTHATVKDTH
jgi:BirA family transcriptional regulator, biotin operon repressor / biotin---[acetyl-CoA-carboxylase] ligase